MGENTGNTGKGKGQKNREGGDESLGVLPQGRAAPFTLKNANF